MGQRTGRLDAMLLEGDRGCFGLAAPARQVTVTVSLAQQQHRLVLRLLDANADDANFTHLCLPSARAAVTDQTWSDVAVQTPSRRTEAVVPKSSPSAVENVAHCGLDQRRVQRDRQGGDFAREVVGAVAGTGLAALDEGPGDLRDQVGLPVGGRAECPEMTRLDAVVGERPGA